MFSTYPAVVERSDTDAILCYHKRHSLSIQIQQNQTNEISSPLRINYSLEFAPASSLRLDHHDPPPGLSPSPTGAPFTRTRIVNILAV